VRRTPEAKMTTTIVCEDGMPCLHFLVCRSHGPDRCFCTQLPDALPEFSFCGRGWGHITWEPGSVGGLCLLYPFSSIVLIRLLSCDRSASYHGCSKSCSAHLYLVHDKFAYSNNVFLTVCSGTRLVVLERTLPLSIVYSTLLPVTPTSH
jgi:hypothetical protein